MLFRSRWWALDPFSNNKREFDSQEAAQAAFPEPLIESDVTLADMDFAAGVGSAVGGFAAELAAATNGFNDVTSRDYRAGFNEGALVTAAIGGGLSVGSFFRSNPSRMIKVTSWADAGITPDLNPGRWVMIGGATKWNFFKSGLPGPKAYLGWKRPFLSIERSKVPFINSITEEVPLSSLEFPENILDRLFKGPLGQRRLKR